MAVPAKDPERTQLARRALWPPAWVALVALARCTCQPAGAPCDSSSDCLATEVCSEGYCRVACNTPADCSAGEICIDGACLPARDRPGQDASRPDTGQPDRAPADALAVDTPVADLAPVDANGAIDIGADAAPRDVGAEERAADDAGGGRDRLPADGSADAQGADTGAPDRSIDSGLHGIDEPCQHSDECESGFCRPADSICKQPTCFDGYQNQDETDVDCGGTCGACPTCWGNAANFDFDDVSLDFSAAVDLSTCSPTIDTSMPLGSMLDNWCGLTPTPVVQSQTGGPSVVVVPMASLKIGAGQTLRLVGDKPVVIAVRGDAEIFGTIDAGARATTPGAGGDLSIDGAIATAGGTAGTGDCSVFAEGTGQGMYQDPGSYSLGGGGAGFRTNGGFGGGERPNFRCYSNAPSYTQVADGYECRPLCPDLSCDNSYSSTVNRYQANNGAHYAVAPIYGLAAPDQSLTPLRGGCAGGSGESLNTTSIYYGGSGGGAVQLTATGTLAIGAGGIVSAGGGGGTVLGSSGSGSGGGSGGAILLEATAVNVSAAAGIRAHGGSGGGRDGGGSGCDSTAEDGHLGDDLYATHPTPSTCVAEGRGGLSYWDVGSAACNGIGATIGPAASCTLPLPDWPTTSAAYPQGGNFTDANGGGGGGGSGGVIIVRRLVGSGRCP